MQVVDLSFSVVGDRVPLDHGYPLYSALSRRVPSAHGSDWLGVHPLGGMPVDGEMLLVRPSTRLRLRVPSDRIPEVLPLSGAQLDVAGSRLRVGVPEVHPLQPAPSLDARLVVLSLTRPPRRFDDRLGKDVIDMDAVEERYKQELSRQMSSLELSGQMQLCGYRRLTIGRARVIGFSVRVDGLSDADSIRLQERGLGGRRAMGCGLFRPTRGGERG